MKVGDEIETYVMRVNDQEGVVTLSKKRLDTVKSWDDIEQAKDDQTVVEGVVTEENKGGIVVSVKGVRVFVPPLRAVSPAAPICLHGEAEGPAANHRGQPRPPAAWWVHPLRH